MALFVLIGAAPALALAPAWRIDAASNTTALPGGTITYHVQVTNVGTATSFGSKTTTIVLPGNVTALSASRVFGFDDTSPDCTAGDGINPVAGASTVTCVAADPVLPRRGAFGTLRYVIVAAVHPTVASPSTVVASFSAAGGGAPTGASTVEPTRIDGASGFGVDAFDGDVAIDAMGNPLIQAAGHPYAVTTSLDFNTVTNPLPQLGDLWPVEPVRDAVVDLPPGLVGSTASVDRCTMGELANGPSLSPMPLCPPTSQVGTVLVRLNGQTGFPDTLGPLPVYNMVPPPNVPAKFGFNVVGTIVTLTARLRSDGDYGLSVDSRDISEGLAISGTTFNFWGVPSDSSHDLERACSGRTAPWVGGPSCTSGAAPRAFLRAPTSCEAEDGLVTNVSIDSWDHPGAQDAGGAPVAGDPNWKHATWMTHDAPGYPYPPSDFGPPLAPTGCDKVPFTPTFDFRPATPTVQANTPTAFAVDVTLPQTDDPKAVAESDLKKSVVTLPEGVRVSPSSADGLAACSPAQIGLDSTADAQCPDASKIATMTIKTPLLDEDLTGSAYLATPHDNPFHSLIAMYLVAKGPGVILKLASNVQTDPDTGQITASVESPQLPFSNLHLEFKGGARAALLTPPSCGTYTTHAELTPWARPDTTVTSDSSFTVDQTATGRPCGSPASRLGFTGGALSPVQKAATTLLVHLTRGDDDQELRSLKVDMPTGALAKIAHVVPCPDGAANAGACQDVSKIGSVTVGAGAGPHPFYIQTGRAYLTGPYKGAPYGLSVVVPAIAGPFDLGNVVVRAALEIDRRTAQVHVISDPLPTILQGIPLGVRDIRVAIDRPDFYINPASCDPKRVRATVTSTQGAVAHLSTHFQMAGCGGVPVPQSISFSPGSPGHTAAGHSTPLVTTIRQRPDETNLRSVSVTLPGTLNARLPVINRACKLAEYDAGHCGNQAKAGTAVAVTPLLRDPLRGNVYFVKNPARILPDLMVALRGPIALDLVGKVSIPGGKRLATRFDSIPDAPITKFTLRIVSGRNGPLGVATNLCSKKGRAARASVAIRGQNGDLVRLNPRMHVRGCPRTRRAR